VALYCLAKNPALQQMCLDEIVSVCALEDYEGKGEELEKWCAPNFEQQKGLTFLGHCINEAIRLFPPIAVLPFRIMAHDSELGGIKVPKGQMVQVDIGMIQRDKRTWGPDADEFRPERQANLTAKQKMATMPFGGGIRQCVGQQFSMMEQKILVAGVLVRYRLELPKGYDEGRDLKFRATSLIKPDLTLVPRKGRLSANPAASPLAATAAPAGKQKARG